MLIDPLKLELKLKQLGACSTVDTMGTCISCKLTTIYICACLCCCCCCCSLQAFKDVYFWRFSLSICQIVTLTNGDRNSLFNLILEHSIMKSDCLTILFYFKTSTTSFFQRTFVYFVPFWLPSGRYVRSKQQLRCQWRRFLGSHLGFCFVRTCWILPQPMIMIMIKLEYCIVFCIPASFKWVSTFLRDSNFHSIESGATVMISKSNIKSHI